MQSFVPRRWPPKPAAAHLAAAALHGGVAGWRPWAITYVYTRGLYYMCMCVPGLTRRLCDKLCLNSYWYGMVRLGLCVMLSCSLCVVSIISLRSLLSLYIHYAAPLREGALFLVHCFSLCNWYGCVYWCMFRFLFYCSWKVPWREGVGWAVLRCFEPERLLAAFAKPCTYVCIYIYTYIYIERERERERDIHIMICMYTCIYI